MADSNQTIIIKKIKKGGHGHHGGAWKVAYADFVTAMMAFFLLLWLLASTSEDTKKGLADYFTPTIGLKDAMGIGVEGGQAPTKDGISKSDLMAPGVVVGQVPQGPINDVPEETMANAEAESKLFDEAAAEFQKTLEQDPNLRDLANNVILEQTPEGLKLELRDDDLHPMFMPQSKEVSVHGQKLLAAIVPLIKKMPNLIAITGHTDAGSLGTPTYTNWELSADRANSARRYMLSQSLNEKKIGKVVGRADQELLLPEAPNSSQNRRIELMLLRGTSVNVMPQQQVVPHSLLNAPRAEDALNKMQQNQKKNNTQRSLSPTADPQRAGAAKLDGLIPLKPVMSSTSSGAGNFVIPQSPSMLPSQKAPIAP